MQSVSGKNWEEITVNKRIVEKLRNDLGFDEILEKENLIQQRLN